MSYCVNCGVELDPTARACPLCHTPAVNPNQPVDTALPPPFPSRREEVQPVSKKELALLLSAMMGSVAVCCGLLNLFFLHSSRPWSLYVIGAAAMLWIWLVPPLVLRRMPLWIRLGLDACAVGVYVYLISIDLRGLDWYLGLALPIVLTGGAIVMALGTGPEQRAVYPHQRHPYHRGRGALPHGHRVFRGPLAHGNLPARLVPGGGRRLRGPDGPPYRGPPPSRPPG